MNRNENLCLLLGNNNTENYFKWRHLPHRESYSNAANFSTDCSETSCPSKRWNWVKKTHDTPSMGAVMNLRWTDAELKLLARAGSYSVGRVVGNIVHKIVKTIHMESGYSRPPPVASSGALPPGLDPELKFIQNGELLYSLSPPLCPETLERIIQEYDRNQLAAEHDGHRGSSEACDSSKQNCWSINLANNDGSENDSGVFVTGLGFQNYLVQSSDNMNDLWSTLEKRFLPALVEERNKCDSNNHAGAGYRVVIKPHRMLVYGKGGKSMPCRDVQHHPTHFGTLELVLPVASSTATKTVALNEGDHNNVKADVGGELILRCCEEDLESYQVQTHSPPPMNSESASWHILMHGTSHEVCRVNSGYRVSATYQLLLEPEKDDVPVPPFQQVPRLDLLSMLGRSIEHWIISNSMEELVEFVLPLQNHYPIHDVDSYPDRSSWRDGGLEPSTLMGQDYWLYRGLLEALKDTDLKLNLEYNQVDLSVPGYPQGVVTHRGHTRMLPEEQSKIIWLHRCSRSTDGPQLVGDSTKSIKAILVACLSISHKRFCCR